LLYGNTMSWLTGSIRQYIVFNPLIVKLYIFVHLRSIARNCFLFEKHFQLSYHFSLRAQKDIENQYKQCIWCSLAHEWNHVFEYFTSHVEISFGGHYTLTLQTNSPSNYTTQWAPSDADAWKTHCGCTSLIACISAITR
jgi:hypothetical protein